ncbi:ABC transporter permease [Undibacterium sp. Jales W-56]|uniref:ABC transporter permease n=1 Tax=Undibacterium sp. Jales W-56 TaxID=2897325 RepID=UPI0021D27675|nr:ABC transporter permease [Undibacterium sp. Jales W-56]MCU6433245.1 ABC transporter permease [Undibacterium sp. Jales W-56]
MIHSISQSNWLKRGRASYLAVFFIFLFLPLLVVALFAFNNAPYPMPPWQGFTWDWFFGATYQSRVGLFYDEEIRNSLLNSLKVATGVTFFSVIVGTGNAFLLERCQFRGQKILSQMMLIPLVIPGVILGISILSFMSRLAQFADDTFGWELEFLRPGLFLVAVGQFSYIVSISSLTISARLKRLDISLEEAAMDLGASKIAIFSTITLPYLQPAIIGAMMMAFLLSFENFNTTYMLVGSDAPLTVLLYGRMKEGATPVVNAVSLMMMVMSGVISIVLYLGRTKGKE